MTRATEGAPGTHQEEGLNSKSVAPASAPASAPSEPESNQPGINKNASVIARIRSLRKLRPVEVAQLLTLLAVPVAYFVATRNVEPSFAVLANTEQIDFQVTQDTKVRWWLAEVQVLDDSAAALASPRSFVGSVVPSTGSRITIGRIAQGPLLMTIDGGDNSSGELFDERGRRVTRLSPTAILRWDSIPARTSRGSTISLSLGRAVAIEQLGQQPRYDRDPTPLLRSGRITLLKRTYRWLGGEIQEIGSETLSLGDQLAFAKGSRATGFVSVDERPGLNASIRVLSRRASITPSGGVPRDVSSTLYDSLRNDRAVQLAVTLLGFAYAVFGFFRSLERPKNNGSAANSGQTPATETSAT